MATVSATEAKNRLGELWALAEDEPVTIERNGVPKYQIIATDRYVAVPRAEYDRLYSAKRAPQFGFASQDFNGFDSSALLSVDISEELDAAL